MKARMYETTREKGTDRAATTTFVEVPENDDRILDVINPRKNCGCLLRSEGFILLD